MNQKRKGQITLFMIVGVIILILVGIFLGLRAKTTEEAGEAGAQLRHLPRIDQRDRSEREHRKEDVPTLSQRGNGEPSRDPRRGQRYAEPLPLDSAVLPLHRDPRRAR